MIIVPELDGDGVGFQGNILSFNSVGLDVRISYKII